MINIIKNDTALSKEQKIQTVLNHANQICAIVFKNRFNNPELSTYKYNLTEPANELGLDEELIVQLIEDYISQIFKAYIVFKNLLSNIHNLNHSARDLKLTDLKNLAHKNLGVARNLRIKDAQVLLTDLMHGNDDLNHLEDCVEALQACAFKLNPTYAYNILQLMDTKSTF